MEQYTPNWLESAILDLAAIEEEGQLSEFWREFNFECRRRDEVRPAEDIRRTFASLGGGFRAREIGRHASDLFGLPLEMCEGVAVQTLGRDVWREIALELIAEFRGRIATKATPKTDPSSKLKRERRVG